ncbi:MAG TPA: dihydroorotate dehydrogenase-like protein [Polyangiaceae bacterium]|nr:dihydroorotate dehydrogenase-like protein [Polyangiaceae bacterium]
MMKLETRYMGLSLRHPVVASASPLSSTLDGIKRLEDGGVSAIVTFSIFEEQIRHEEAAFARALGVGLASFAESSSYLPEVAGLDDPDVGADGYLELLRRAREAVDIPVIASLNCVTPEGWVDYAKRMEQAGASALELNIYAIEADLSVSGAAVEQRYLDILRAVKGAVSVPVALKLSPFFSAMGNMARRLDEAGADALVLFNRFYQPDVDIDHLELLPTRHLGTPDEVRLPLLWIALLYGRVRASLGATRGVDGPAEVIKYLLAGADAVLVASSLIRHGPAHARTLVDGLARWMETRGFTSVDEARGVMSHGKVADPSAFERANYLRVMRARGERR